MIYLPVLLLEEDDGRGQTIAIVDGSDGWAQQIGQILDEHHSTPDGFPLYPRVPLFSPDSYGQRTEAAAMLESGFIDAYLILGDEFEMTGEVSYIGRDRGRILEQEQLRRAVRSTWTQAAFQRYDIDSELQNILRQDILWTSYAAKEGDLARADEVQAFLTPIIYVMILFFAVFFSSQILMRSIITERGNRVVEMLLSSITSRDLMTGKILGLGLVGLTQISIYLLVTSLAWAGRGVEMLSGGELIVFLLYAVVGYFFYAAIYAAIGSLFETEQDAQQVLGLLSLIPILPVLFSSYVVIHPGAMLVRVASFIPPLTPFLMIIRQAVTEVSVWEVVATVLVLMATTVLMMRWAGTIFRTAILLYGKRITFPEIVRWLRVSRSKGQPVG
jgi:ABC-2 type transport system permease protein